jgi:hypothetical protein
MVLMVTVRQMSLRCSYRESSERNSGGGWSSYSHPGGHSQGTGNVVVMSATVTVMFTPIILQQWCTWLTCYLKLELRIQLGGLSPDWAIASVIVTGNRTLSTPSASQGMFWMPEYGQYRSALGTLCVKNTQGHTACSW